MPLTTYIRKEDKNRWERRAPLTPDAVAALVQAGIPVWVERAPDRLYADTAYQQAGATLTRSSTSADIVLGIKEPALAAIRDHQVHLAFSHTIKGQPYNMGLLKTFMARKCTLIDYELIKDEKGVRSIAFGRFAGIAGAVDTLHVFGRKLAQKDHSSLAAGIHMAHHYETLGNLENQLRQHAHDFEEDATKTALLQDLPGDLKMVITGSGNVGKGCVEVCEWLGLPRVDPARLAEGNPPRGSWYSVLKTANLVASKSGGGFSWREYREFGKQRYESIFHQYLGTFNLLLQTPYWDEDYPPLLPRAVLTEYADDLPLVIGDISCDINGSLECTLAATTIDEPAYTYLPASHAKRAGISWDGPTIMAIDHLPCELSRDASEHFSNILARFLPELVAIDLSMPLESCGLSKVLRDAVIVYKGELTPGFTYLEDYLDG